MASDKRFCAPSKGNDKYTCFTYNSLTKIANKWNLKHPDDEIDMEIYGKNNKQDLHKLLKRKLEKGAPCKKEFCWNKHPVVEDLNDPEIIYETFRPEKPLEWYDNHKAWLSTSDIQHVLLQYEAKHPDFYFIGPVPIDFDKQIAGGKCISTELCKLDIVKLYRDGKRYIGVVFNLDPHDAPGSHWVSLFIDLTNGGVYYYDSVGKFPSKEVVQLMRRIAKQGNNAISSGVIDHRDLHNDHSVKLKLKGIQEDTAMIDNGKAHPYMIGMPAISKLITGGKKKRQKFIVNSVKDGIVKFNKKIHPDTDQININGFRLFYNDIAHQKENTECGVYSIDFISSLLEGETFQNYTANVKRDDALNRLRDIFYRPASDKVTK